MLGLSVNWQDLGYRIVSRVQKRKTPDRLPIRLHGKRVYILPTRFGVFFGLFTLVMVVAGLNYNNNMALLLAFLIGGMALLAPLYTVRNLVDLSIAQITAQPVFAGEAARFAITLVNDSSQPRPVVWATCGDSEDVTDIPAAGRANLQVEQPARERGWMSLARTRLLTRYPVGLFFAWAWIEPDTRCLVYPRPEKTGPHLPRGLDMGTGRPERAGDEEWAGLREYQAGDPSRWIAWKAMARTGEMVTKTFAQHESERIELDFSRLVELDTEQRLSRLARWILEADQADLVYTLRLPGQEIGPGAGDEHRHRCLRALAEY